MKRWLSLFLACTMLLSLCPSAVIAMDADEGSETETVQQLLPEEIDGEEVVFTERSTIVTYPVTGGNLYFDTVTGTVTDCDTSVTVANIPEKINGVAVTAIGIYAFSYCDSLTSIELPGGLASIGDAAFYSCDSLTSIDIPDGVTSIGNSAFASCDSLTSIELPDSLTSIGYYAFSYCDSLTSIELPGGLASIGDSAFFSCGSLTDVYYGGTAEQWSGISIGYGNDSLLSATIHYNSYSGGNDNSAAKIAPLISDEIELNGIGTAYPVFRLTNQGEPWSGALVRYTVDGKTQTVVTNSVGVFSVTLPAVKKTGTFSISFALPGHSGTINGAAQDITVKVNPFSTSQKWKGMLGIGGSVGGSLGIGANVGAASLTATAAEAKAKGKTEGSLSVEHSYEGDGSRTLEIIRENNLSVGTDIGAGVGLTAGPVEVKVIGASAGAFKAEETGIGIKIKNYDPENKQHRDSIGTFLLWNALIGNGSVVASQLLERLHISASNQAAYKEIVGLEAGASLGSVQIGEDGLTTEVTLAGADVETVLSHEVKDDRLESTTTYEANAVATFGYGLGKNLSFGIAGGNNDISISGKTEIGNYVLGAGGSNSLSIEAKLDAEDKLSEISYKTYEEGEKDILWNKTVEEVSSTVTYDKENAAKIVGNNTLLNQFASGNRSLLSVPELCYAVDAMALGEYTGIIEESLSEKTGYDLSLPLELSLGLSIGVELSGAYTEEYSHVTGSGILHNGHVYTTTVSTPGDAKLDAQRYELTELLAEPIVAIAEEVAGWFTSVGNAVKEGVQNACAAVKGTVSGWYASVTSMWSKDKAITYAIMTLDSEEEPDTNAAVSLTLGDPYTVAVYTDESMTEQVSDEALAANPLTLTLEYTQEMLAAAGADAAADVYIFYFDSERNIYVCLQESEQDKSAMTVTAPIFKQGEYILATDNASPLISEFYLSDNTANPTLYALVSDFSGIKEFSFCLDGEEELVGSDDFADHYDAKTGWFSCELKDLSSGEHTAYFTATDMLGNQNMEPFTFTFTVDVDAPIISDVTVPTEVVTDKSGFTVTAEVVDDQLSTVLLNATAEGANTVSIPMKQGDDGLWTAEVTGVYGLDAVDVKVVATDNAGNRSESQMYEVRIGIPVEETGLSLTPSLEADGTVRVAAYNNSASAVSGWLICAAYDSNGKMIATSDAQLTLRAGEELSFELPFEQNIQNCTVKCFLLDTANGYMPMSN